MSSTVSREINAFISISCREVIRFTKSPATIISNLLLPIITIGMIGGSISQNLASNTGYDFLQFIVVGMIIFNMFMGSVSGVISLVSEREINLTQELFVSPISRYTIILGKIVGSGVSSILTLIGILIVALFMKIDLGGLQILNLIFITPVFCLVGASLGLLFIGLVKDQNVAQMGVMIVGMPQMFLAGTIIPIVHSSGILTFLSKIMPLTYLTDLGRGVFYRGSDVYDLIVMNSPLTNIIIISIYFLVFFILGSKMYIKSELVR